MGMNFFLLPECPVVVVADSVHHIKVSPWCAGYGPVPAVPHPSIHVASIEGLKPHIHLEEVLGKVIMCTSLYTSFK